MTELFGFNTLSFEQFIQTTAIEVLGPGIVVYGAGPDGGREGTFEGRMPYPFETDQWEGYGVIQAKYKAKTEGTALDQEWALNELEAELEKFGTAKKQRRPPDYYIFATNVTLTPAAGGGGKDRADELVKAYRLKYPAKLPLKGYRIWDKDQLNGFLARYTSLRHRYRAQITTGDVLHAIIQRMERESANQSLILTAYLERTLREDRNAKLDQAGEHSEIDTPLADVFIDLPTADQQLDDYPADDDDSSELASGFLDELLQLSELVLEPKALDEFNVLIDADASGFWRQESKFVLIGGPGSGKSTLGQYFAQINRAAMLATRPDTGSSVTAVTKIVDRIREKCVRDKLPWPATPRLPLRVELSAFAKALAADDRQITSLESYIVRSIDRNGELKVIDLRELLVSSPCLLILDGLDEVPASSNRSEVCKAIQDFLIEAGRLNSNLLVLATTRPEGYDNEFGAEGYHAHYLLPLSLRRAMAYARRFLEARVGGEDDVTDMLGKLEYAARDNLTARLMQSPLQVTFMATLVIHGGSPPRDRWTLFNRYFGTIYRREEQKASADLKVVLTEHRTLITRVHHDVGLLLQALGEQASGTNAVLPMAAFRQLVRAHIEHEEFEGAEAARLEDTIVLAATDRLVFLTARTARDVSFEVRSLQEYMAAERLMSGQEELVRKRLAAIAPLAYWRNVVLFAIGQCFAESRLDHFRLIIREMCEDLNAEGCCPPGVVPAWVPQSVLAGSELALAILEDGTVSTSPKYTNTTALPRLVGRWPFDRLAAVPPGGCHDGNADRRPGAGVH